MRPTAQLLVAIVLLGGCGGDPATTETVAELRPEAAAAAQASSATQRTELAELRRVTAPFHRFENAVAAGWSTQITSCMTDPAGAGGMGFHYGNTALIDGSVRVDQPELLLYEPGKNGRLRLVAVEYIIPYAARSRDATPPVLFGHEFKRNDVFQLWGLHAWVWRENPSGMFADWNPRVTCEHTADVAAMAHDG